MEYALISESTEEPITLTEAKAHLKMTGIDDEDDLITAQISAVRAKAESITHRQLVQRVYDYYLDAFPVGDSIAISKAPLLSVASITYIDANGSSQTLSTDVYGVNADLTSPDIYLKFDQSWPATRAQRRAVTIRLTTGYPNSDTSPRTAYNGIPPEIAAGMKIMLRDLFDNRGSTVDMAGAKGTSAWNLLAGKRRRT